jgi:hypothetical protein
MLFLILPITPPSHDVTSTHVARSESGPLLNTIVVRLVKRVFAIFFEKDLPADNPTAVSASSVRPCLAKSTPVVQDMELIRHGHSRSQEIGEGTHDSAWR